MTKVVLYLHQRNISFSEQGSGYMADTMKTELLYPWSFRLKGEIS